MPDVTLPASEYRLDVSPDDPTLVEGLRAEVADPVWLVAVQRALGETLGVDGGSPVAADLTTSTATVNGWLPRLPDGSDAKPLPTGPLEVVLEDERQPDDSDMPHALRLATLAGRQYLRLLGTSGPDELTAYRADLMTKYPLGTDLDPDVGDPLLTLAPGRTVDGRALYRDLDTALRENQPPALPAEPQVAAENVAQVTKAAQAFLAWFDAVVGGGGAGTSAWLPERFEYQLSLRCGAAEDPEDDDVFVADQFASGFLDWYDFDLAATGIPGGPAEAGATPPQTTRYLPVAVNFHGAPVSSHWTFEDASVELGAAQASPEDLATMVVIDFAVRYTNDFFIIPLALTPGTYTGVQSLTVTDTFDEPLVIDPASQEGGQFRLFEHVRQGSDERIPAILIPPAVTGVLEGAAFETVLLLRDEVADICWALEKKVLGNAGEPIDLSALLAQSRPTPAPPIAPDPASAGRLHYQLRATLASNWYPIVVTDPDDPTHLHVVKLEPLPDQGPQPSPSSRVLTELAASATGVPTEEITRDGLTVERWWRYARSHDGTQYLWAARRALPARPTAMPNLGFDQALQP